MRRPRARMTVRMLMGAVAIAALAALFAADLSRAGREAGNRASCVGQLKSILVGLHHYHATYGTSPRPPSRIRSCRRLAVWVGL